MQSVDLRPPWIEFPDIPWGSVGWRMGFGEQHWLGWGRFYESLPQEKMETYKSQWPEPKDWTGFYAFIETGATPPHLLKEKESLEVFAIPPHPSEDVIREPRERIKRLTNYYFKRPKASVRDPYEKREHIILADPEGWLWKLVFTPHEEQAMEPPFFEKQKAYVIGENNVEVRQPIA